MAILSSLLSLAMQKAEGDLGLCEGRTYDADGTDMHTSFSDTAKADVHLGRSEREKYMIEETDGLVPYFDTAKVEGDPGRGCRGKYNTDGADAHTSTTIPFFWNLSPFRLNLVFILIHYCGATAMTGDRCPTKTLQSWCVNVAVMLRVGFLCPLSLLL